MLYVLYERIGFTASEEKSFENVDNGLQTDGRTTDTSIYYKLTYEPSAQVANNNYIFFYEGHRV